MKYRVEGRLSLKFEIEPTTRQTIMRVLDTQPPLKVVRAFEADYGAALVHLHNVSGGVLGGDHLILKAHIGEGARAQITTTSATRIYRNRVDMPASYQLNELSVAENGLLELLPDPLIPFAYSAYQQRTSIKLAEGAGLFWWETVAPGREARNECFDYDLLGLEVDIQAKGRPIALEYARLEPKLRPLSSAARLDAYRYFSTFYICKVGLPAAQWTALEAELGELAGMMTRANEILWGVSTLVRDGLVVRGVSCEGRSLSSGLLAFWRAAKLALYGQIATPPRKVY
ncbi:MAG: urease accessory protein UreD [Anaerolineae bacterium]|nr:urease accessory protein UreD [Anaerolineae bacterium]